MSRFCQRPIRKGLWPLSLLLTFSLLFCLNLRATPQAPTQGRPQYAHPKPATATPSSTQPLKFKGIFEPVNYNQDLTLLDAFFVSPEEGWVAGAAGTILHTVDGGKTWTAQLGGDPQAAGPDLKRLFFLDRRHGWAQNGDVLLRTTDGENWQQVASDVRGDVVFTNPRVGFRGYGGIVYQTLDGGATWKQIYTCATRVIAQGLTQQITCDVAAIHFPSPRIGYGVGTNNGVLGGGVVVKTEDGGATWNVVFIPQESGDQRTNIVSFLDEDRGFALRNTGMYRTTDGSRSWQGVAANLARNDVPLKFADPEVGWVAGQLPASGTARLTYTADGGAHWLARDLHFPAVMNGFSLPRRDRGYIVGDHGMIYRYRVVPLTYQTAAHSFDAPVMPGFDSPVFGEVATLNDVVTKLRAKLPGVGAPSSQAAIQLSAQSAGQIVAPVGQASTQASAQAAAFQQDTNTPGSTGTGAAPNAVASTGASPAAGFPQDAGTVPGAVPAGPAGGFQQDPSVGPVAGGYLDSCCGPLIQQLETTANSFATNVPTFSQHFRNLNLVFEGLNFLNSVVNQANTLKQSIRALRQAKNAQAASVALTTVQSQVNGISTSGGFVQDVSTPPQP